MNDDTVLIDNSKTEMASLLGSDYLNYELLTINYPDGQTLEDFWRWHDHGTYMLLTQSAKQPKDGASVHITVLKEGSILRGSTALLKKKLVGAQMIVAERGPVN
jgi:hypothetical protein